MSLCLIAAIACGFGAVETPVISFKEISVNVDVGKGGEWKFVGNVIIHIKASSAQEAEAKAIYDDGVDFFGQRLEKLTTGSMLTHLGEGQWKIRFSGQSEGPEDLIAFLCEFLSLEDVDFSKKDGVLELEGTPPAGSIIALSILEALFGKWETATLSIKSPGGVTVHPASNAVQKPDGTVVIDIRKMVTNKPYRWSIRVDGL